MKDSLSRRSEGGTSGDRFHVHYKATELYFFQQYCSTFAERLLVRNTVLLYWSDSSIFGDCNHHVKDSLGRCLVDETENSIQKCTSMAVQSSVISRAHFDSHEHFYDHYKNTWLSSFLLYSVSSTVNSNPSFGGFTDQSCNKATNFDQCTTKWKIFGNVVY
jgi:hypothetical protein